MKSEVGSRDGVEVIPGAEQFLPDRRTLRTLQRAVQECQGCPLYRDATQAVFGEGPTTARLLLVGEVPGDAEDREGHPFVGPAGRLLDEALAAAELSRKEIYITNAVKHFKWEPRGGRRYHQHPSAREIRACRPWLEAEMALVHPQTILCLGAIAAQALLGRQFRLTKQRGLPQSSEWADRVMATYHPAAVLRAPEAEQRRRMRAEFFADVLAAAKTVS